MADNNSHNDPFDNLFRRNEDKINIPFREEDWLKLEKKLDRRDAKILYRRRLGYIAAAAILLISMIGYLAYDNYLRLNELDRAMEDQITSSDMPQDRGQLTDPGIAATDNDTDDEEEGQNETELGDSNQTTGEQNIPFDENVSDRDEFASNLGEDEDENETGNVNVNGMPDFEANRKRNATGSTFSTAIDPAEFLVGVHCSDCSITEKRDGDIDRDSDQVEFNGRLSLANSRDLEALRTDAISAHSFETDENPEMEMLTGRRSKFSIGIKAAPDLSTVGGLTNFQSPGYSFGFDVAYRINNRLSVSSGVARSVVRYKADGAGYDTPIYLNGGVVPDRLTGECVLLDIPLSLRYNVLNFSGSRIFATGSLSSYIMLNEAYRFGYDNSYGSTPEYNYKENTGTSHFMSNAGLSIGYEHDLNAKFSIRFEPQIKIPIREVGVTNVRLFSLGSFFSLSYNF